MKNLMAKFSIFSQENALTALQDQEFYQKNVFSIALKWGIAYGFLFAWLVLILYFYQRVWSLLFLSGSHFLVALMSWWCLKKNRQKVMLWPMRFFLMSASLLVFSLVVVGSQGMYWTGILGLPVIVLLAVFLESSQNTYLWGVGSVMLLQIALLTRQQGWFPDINFGYLEPLFIVGVPSVVIIVLVSLGQVTYGYLKEALLNSKKQSLALEATNTNLNCSNKELEQFAYVVSHDLRAPLRALKSYSLFLEEDYGEELDELALEYIEGITENAQQMDQLVVDLLEYSRIGRQQVKSSMVDLGKLLTRLASRFDLQEKADLHLPATLPKIWGIEVRLEQIFSNLLTNAVKFQRPNTQAKVRIESTDLGDEWQFCVQDNGIGISEKYFDKIFGVFQRLHTQEEYEGTGIGMAIVKKAVEEHGGKIWLESKVGEGTIFKLTLPKK